MAKLTGSTTEPNTPAPKKGGAPKNAFPSFTPATTRMTRAQAKAAGIDEPIALDLQVSTRKPKKTKIPAGVGLEQIPSPGNLKVVRKMRGAAKKEKVQVEDVIDDLGVLELGGKNEKKEGGSSKTSRKGKESAVVEKDEEENKEEEKTGRLTRSNTAIKHDVKTNDKTKGKGMAKAISKIPDSSDEDMDTFDIDPRLYLKSSTTNITSSSTDVDNEALRTSLAPFTSSKKLWEMEDSDVTELRIAAESADEGSGAETVLKGMLDVVEKFQAFRDGLDEYMEDMEELGLVLFWEDEGAEGDE